MNMDFGKEYVGESYNYVENIKSPKEINMSSDGNLDALANDIAGLLSYTKLLVEGNSYASKNGGKPFGNSYFLKTLGECVPSNFKGEPDTDKGDKAKRYIYVNNIPQGNIGLLPGNYSSFRGLIPGIVNNITEMNPVEILGGLTGKLSPPCAKIKMDVIDKNNNVEKEEHFVALNDIKPLNPCLFGGHGGKNPVSGKVCNRAGFQNINNLASNATPPKLALKKNNFANIYQMSLGLSMIYLLYKILK
jgi:hypothetical protein